MKSVNTQHLQRFLSYVLFGFLNPLFSVALALSIKVPNAIRQKEQTFYKHLSRSPHAVACKNRMAPYASVLQGHNI